MSAASDMPDTEFNLSDVDSFMSKKPNVQSKSIVPLPRSVPPQTRAKSVGRKRKSIATPSDNSFEGLSTHDAVAKAEIFLQQCLTQIGKNEGNLIRENEELKQALEDSQKISAAKSQHIEDLRKEFENEKKSSVAAHAQALQKVKKAAAKVVFESRVKMYEEAGDKDFDLSTWDIKGWRETLANLSDDVAKPSSKDDEVIEIKDPELQVKEGGAEQGNDGKDE